MGQNGSHMHIPHWQIIFLWANLLTNKSFFPAWVRAETLAKFGACCVSAGSTATIGCENVVFVILVASFSSREVLFFLKNNKRYALSPPSLDFPKFLRSSSEQQTSMYVSAKHVCVWWKLWVTCDAFTGRRVKKPASLLEPLAAPVNLLGAERPGRSAAGISCLLILGGRAHFLPAGFFGLHDNHLWFDYFSVFLWYKARVNASCHMLEIFEQLHIK